MAEGIHNPTALPPGL